VKKLFLFLLVTSSVIQVSAQQSKSTAPAVRFPTIPPFTLLKADSTSLTREDLPKHKKTLFIYFSPTCEHCLLQFDSLLANMSKFKDIQILMATYQPLEEMKNFYNEKHIAAYKNIQMGRDTKFFFPPFFKMNNLPFLALYDDKGKLVTVFEGTTKIPFLLEAFSRKK
jgi:thiol-disulfide isomerase/thioredoxin